MKARLNQNIEFYWKHRRSFTFSGDHLRHKSGEILKIAHDKNGIDGVKAFVKYDSTGVLVGTRHPNIFFTLLKAKASAHFHIKQYATDRASGLLSGVELSEILHELSPPSWFVDSIESQRISILT